MSKPTEPVKYHQMSHCNKCGVGVDTIKEVEWIEHTVAEAETTCQSCGFKDLWSYGFFMSGSEMESKCKTYTI